MKNDEEIRKLKEELFEKFGIKTDTDLIKQLGIKEDDKSKLFAWVKYQCAYSFRDGLRNGKKESKKNRTFDYKTIEAHNADLYGYDKWAYNKLIELGKEGYEIVKIQPIHESGSWVLLKKKIEN